MTVLFYLIIDFQKNRFSPLPFGVGHRKIDLLFFLENLLPVLETKHTSRHLPQILHNLKFLDEKLEVGAQ